MRATALDRLLEPVLGHLRQDDPGRVAGVYLYGSLAGDTDDPPRPDSDIDLLVLTRESLTAPQRAALTAILLETSGWKGHGSRFGAVARRRPIDLTALVVSDVQPLPATPQRDFQFGEWLREPIVAGVPLLPTPDPDVVVLLATALHDNRVLQGSPLAALVEPVPQGLLRQALIALIPALVDNLEGDERNTVLALARSVVTAETGEIVAKDVVAARVAPRLSPDQGALLSQAAREYLGGPHIDWASSEVRELAATLVHLVHAAVNGENRG